MTRTVIHLGNFSTGIANIDPNGTGSAENAAALLGQTYTRTTMSSQSITYSDGNNDGFVNFDGTITPTGDYVTYDLGSGPVSSSVNQAVWYDVNIVLKDGSSFVAAMLIFQTASGETFLTEFSSAAQLDNLNIQSITPTRVVIDTFARMNTAETITNATVCFARASEIMTPDGPRPIEDFRPGDLVLTTDGSPQPVRAVYRIPAAPGQAREAVRFSAQSLGRDTPKVPLIVTANHRMLCASPLVERMFGCAEVLIPAKRFVGLPGIDLVADACETTFYHLELATHSVICANNALTESCLLGPVVLDALPSLLRVARAVEPLPAPRYPAPTGQKQKNFVRRLAKNRVPPVETTRLKQYLFHLLQGSLAHC